MDDPRYKDRLRICQPSNLDSVHLLELHDAEVGFGGEGTADVPPGDGRSAVHAVFCVGSGEYGDGGSVHADLEIIPWLGQGMVVR